MKSENLLKRVSLTGLAIILMTIGFQDFATAGDKSYKWKIGQPYPKGTLQYELTEGWINSIKTASNGRIQITHYPGSLLGDYVAQAEAVAMGSLDLTMTWPTTSVAGDGADLSLMGYLYSNWDEYANAMNGWMYDLQKKLYKDIDWEILGTLPDGLSVIVSTEKFDVMPGPKDVKIRLMSTETVQVRFNELGFRTLTMPMSEFVTALSLGTVDAGGNASWAEAWYNYKDAIKYVYNSRDMATNLFLIMNKKLFASLSEADQQMISQKSLDWSRKSYEAVLKANGKYRQQLDEAGIIIVDYTQEQWVTNAKLARAKEWPLMEKKVGKEVMDIVRLNATKL